MADPAVDELTPAEEHRHVVLRRRARLLTIAFVVLAVVAVAVVTWISTAYPRTDDAEVFANFIGMAPVVEGPITQLKVADNQFVKQGQLLFEIDDRPYKYALQQAISAQSALEGQIEDERLRIGAARHAVVASQAGTRSALANVDRVVAGIHEAEADVDNAQ